MTIGSWRILSYLYSSTYSHTISRTSWRWIRFLGKRPRRRRLSGIFLPIPGMANISMIIPISFLIVAHLFTSSNEISFCAMSWSSWRESISRIVCSRQPSWAWPVSAAIMLNQFISIGCGRTPSPLHPSPRRNCTIPSRLRRSWSERWRMNEPSTKMCSRMLHVEPMRCYSAIIS